MLARGGQVSYDEVKSLPSGGYFNRPAQYVQEPRDGADGASIWLPRMWSRSCMRCHGSNRL